MMGAVPPPLSRPTAVTDFPPEGVEVTVEATPDERHRLASDFKLPALHALTGKFLLSGTRSRVHVSGRVSAAVSQVCVVTLDPFDSQIDEDVEVDFAAPGAVSNGQDPPDEIVNGAIDLGILTAEFFVLGLDPYPRRPGADFTFERSDDPAESPFAALEKLKR